MDAPMLAATSHHTFILWFIPESVDLPTSPRSLSLQLRLPLIHQYKCRHLEENPTCGGVCGEITIRDVRYHNFLDASQFFEYKVRLWDSGSRFTKATAGCSWPSHTLH